MPTLKQTGFTEQELWEIQSVARQVWEYIAGDVMQAVQEEGKSSIPRSHVMELVLDAGRLEERLRARNRSLAERFAALDYKDAQKVIKPAFPYGRYE